MTISTNTIKYMILLPLNPEEVFLESSSATVTEGVLVFEAVDTDGVDVGRRVANDVGE